MIVIIDYGMGNLSSIQNMLKKISVKSIISSNISVIKNADKLILPGVGSFDNGMGNLQKMSLISVLNKKVLIDKTLILGICLGMQLISKRSEEGRLPGLGWIEAEAVKFKFDNNHANLKIPHIGWNTIKIKKDCLLFKDMEENARFYFVHSYHLICTRGEDIAAMTDYGYEFPSIIQKENIFGVQFHPEKSHKFGKQLLKNFVEILC